MCSTDLSRVVGILRSMYPQVETLEGFSKRIVFSEGRPLVLVEESDSNRFKAFVTETFVCYDKITLQEPSCKQICSVSELLAFILNTLKRKRKRNILTYGYGFKFNTQGEQTGNCFAFQSNLSQNAAYIFGSDLWTKVITRLGTDVTRCLLENCSIFVAVPPTCLFQVCGVPAYDQVPPTSLLPGFSLQSRSRTKNKAPFGGRNTLRGKQCLDSQACAVMDDRIVQMKRKRYQMNEDETTEHSKKRRRLDQYEATSIDQSLSTDSAAACDLVYDKGSASNKSPHTSILTGNEENVSKSVPTKTLPPSQYFIRTLGFVYGGTGMCAFILNKKKKVGEASRRLLGEDLVRIIFLKGPDYLKEQEKNQRKLPRRLFYMVPFFTKLLSQHKKCSYRRLLQKMCPLVKKTSDGNEDLNLLLRQCCSPHRVYLFVRECLATVIPPELWGSEDNQRHFYARVSSFLRRGKFEMISIGELMWKMKVNDCNWLKISKTGRIPPSELAYRTRLLGQFLGWLLEGYVTGLVRCCFYVTEGVNQKNALKFYRHDVWPKLRDLAFRNHVSECQIEELAPDEVMSLPSTTVISRLRFIPKTDGMRAITAVVGADAKTKFHRMRLQDLKAILLACVKSSPSLLGSTVWGMSGIHKVLSSFAPLKKERVEPFYFVKVDVSGAYNSLPHKKLQEVIGQALASVDDKDFNIRTFVKIWADSHEGIRRSFELKANIVDEIAGTPSMKNFVASLQRSKTAHHAILVEQHFSSGHYVKEQLEFFTQMLTGNIIQHGKRMYRRCQGIPQGSLVSSLLCCLCYGHMENTLFKDFPKDKVCFMRLIDDFLLITTEKWRAKSFLMTLFDGVPEYGLVANPQKVVANFQASTWSHHGITTLPYHSLFPWCGLLLDTKSLEVYKDYSSYAGLSLRYTLTLGSVISPGQQMRRKLMGIIRLKCHSVFVDLKTNSLETVYKNVYHLVLLHACRFHVCAQSLPFGQTVSKNPRYFLNMIQDMAHYTNRLIRLSNKGEMLGCKSQTGMLQYEAVELIFCNSFVMMMSKHRSMYKDVLLHLRKWKRSLEQRLGDLRVAIVRQVTQSKTPVDFLACLF
ncbi:telomerase reverse transcriptase [Synchiropus splendidus]|uniref:telomerase reverse transcriptase n=1 Tax=Synchiropus splendidus TaxID=270530 RepID=UPI00237D3CB3|nr:telomerase reverse transcriptase [Synchiropus splendidus]